MPDQSPTLSPDIRPATPDDADALADLEKRCFDSDRISRRQFRYLLTRGNASVLLAEIDGELVGDVVLLYSRGTSVARMYSLGVDPAMRGRQLGRALIKAAEAEAWKHERAYLRLEVRKDNIPAIRLYESMGYHRFGELPEYYQDHMDAWRFEKTLAPDLIPSLRPMPWYEQTLEFTCGPASLMMAMGSLRPELTLNRKLELRLWREATTIFMTAGHGGCGPYGLAIAAARRGFRVEVYVTNEGVHLIDSVRSEEKKEVMGLVQEDMAEELRALGVPITIGALNVEEMEEIFHKGGVPLVLISSWMIYGEKFPHWVVVAGFDDSFVYVNDPYVDHEQGETPMDSIHMPIHRVQFEQMARYGRVGLKSAVVVYPERTACKSR